MPFWPFGTLIREAPSRKSTGGRKRDRSKAKAARRARKANR